MTTDQQSELQALRERVGQLEAARGDVLAADPRLEGLRQWSESIERGNNAWFMLWRGQPKWITVTTLAVVGVPLLCGFLVALVLMGIDIAGAGKRAEESRIIGETYAEVDR